jgi:hypothetical protein
MNTLTHLFGSPGWTRLLYVLLHTLWQGALLALALWLALRALPARRTELRYGLALASLAGLLIAGLVTWSVLDLAVPGKGKVLSPSAALVADSPGANLASASRPAPAIAAPGQAEPFGPPAYTQPATSPPWVAWGAMIWLLGCVVMACRLLLQWVDLQRVPGRCRPVREALVQETATRLGLMMHLKRQIGILTGDHIASPSVFGVVRPMLLLPPALLAGIPVEQLEAIIAHELGHIRRHDYLVNLVQQLVESLLFFNPAVWWVNRQIRIEREACCDRLAVEVTGKPNAYAWSLARWVEQRQAPTPALAPAFGAPRNPGGPLDRLKRLLLAEYRPVVRLPWYSLTSVLVVSGILLAGLWQGTHLAVSFAAELLTPAQRIQKIADIDQKFPPNKIVDSDSPAQPGAFVSGLVREADGSPVTENLVVHIQVENGRSSAGYGISGNHSRFESRVIAGRVYLEVSARGYAPTFLGPYTVESGGKLENLNVVLERGYPGHVKVVNEKGQSIPGVEIKGSYTFPAAGFSYGATKTGADGVAVFDHAATNTMRLQATAAGYQYDECDNVVLPQNGEWVWTLKPARPTKGIVVARQTGQPIADAKFVLISRDGLFGSNWGDPQNAPVLATSDARGEFALTSLNEKSSCTLVAMAPGYAGEMVRSVTAGQADLKIALGPELVVRGKIRGDLSQLNLSQPEITVQITLRLHPNSSHSFPGGHFPIDIREGTGYFAFTNSMPAMITLSVGEIREEIDLAQPINDLVIDLDAKKAELQRNLAARREVVIKIQAPPSLPPPTTPLIYGFWSDLDHHGHSARIGFTNGEARVLIPAPGGISIESADLPGYWFERVQQPITPGNEPYELVLHALPAGAISGRVINADGSDAPNIYVSVVELEKSPLRNDTWGLGVDAKTGPGPNDGTTHFLAQPLPLGGKYAVVAHRKQSFVISETVELGEAAPIRQLLLKLAPGIELRGRVVDWAQKPIAAVPIGFCYTTFDHGFETEAVLTDADGRFGFREVNPDVRGGYTISVRNVPGLQSYSAKVDFRKLPMSVVLVRGEKLEGSVVDDKTGYPIPGATVMAFPHEVIEKTGNGFLSVETATDQDGRFRFTTMAKHQYQLLVQSAQIGDGNHQVHALGGQTGLVTLRVTPSPGSQLKARPPKE